MKVLSTVIRSLMISVVATAALFAQISVVSELSQDTDVRTGQTYTGTIVLHNDTNEPQEAKIYQTDYTFQFDGTNKYGVPGSHPRSNAPWISFSPAFITLPPKGLASVNYVITVPKETPAHKLVGTYWSMLMVEGIRKGSAESSSQPKNGAAEMGITQNIRYGVQIATSIEKTGEKKIRFVATNLNAKKGGKRMLDIDIENIGDLGMRPDVYVELFNNRGVSMGQYPGMKYRIYPGTSVRQLIDVSKVKKGTYKAMVAVDAGGDNVFGAQYTLNFK
ncbi:MAG: hypothetical protein KA247_00765 [Bacteroidetes bacterium]|nr:hypothetical protein [Bacteroidota bacterium]